MLAPIYLPEHSVIFQQPQRFRLLGSIRVLMYKTDLKSKLVFKTDKLTFALGTFLNDNLISFLTGKNQ